MNNSSFSTPKMIALRAPSHAPTGTPTLPHAEPRAAGARARRTTTHAAARRSAPLLRSTPICTGACTFFRHHAAPERDAPGRTLHREARAAARRARRPPSSRYVTRAGLLCSLHAACTAALPVLNIQPACSALRPCRLAPDTTQILHCTRWGEIREPEAGSTPDGRESGGKRDERFKANFIARPGAPRF